MSVIAFCVQTPVQIDLKDGRLLSVDMITKCYKLSIMLLQNLYILRR